MRYICDPHIIPTIVPRDLSEIEAYVPLCARFTNWIHIDFADGVFAPTTTWPLERFDQLPELVRLRPLITNGMNAEAHLMVSEPHDFGLACARAGIARIVAHVEAFQNAEEIRSAFSDWKEAGVKEVGLAIKIDTPLSALETVIGDCDVVLLMSIGSIGPQGNPFDERALSRVEEFHAIYPEIMVAVDGGITEATVEELVRAGANRLTVGSALKTSPTPEKTYMQMLERAMKGCVPTSEEGASVLG